MTAQAAALNSVAASPNTPAQTRVIDTALALFAEHGIGGTSLQMIADAIGVTKAAVYHQYRTKDEIVLAVAEVVLGRLEAAVAAAEAEQSPSRARDVLVARLIDVAVERRREASVLQRDPVMLRCLERHAPFRRVMERLNRILMGGVTDAQARVRAAMTASAVAATVIHPLVLDLDDETLRTFLQQEVRNLPAGSSPMPESAADVRDHLADEFEIRDLVHRYADASSRRDPAGVASTFTADGEWQAAALGHYQGRDALATFFATMLEGWNAFIQGLLSGNVVFDKADPDRARGRWFVLEMGQRSEGANFNAAGVYHDEYVRDAGAWHIIRRQYDPLLARADDVVTALPFPTNVAKIE
jgi:AcrR family transcriptional regulator